MKKNWMISVIQNCPYCGDNSFSWRPQPLILGKMCYLVLQYWWLVHQSVNCCWYSDTWASLELISGHTLFTRTNVSFQKFSTIGKHIELLWFNSFRKWRTLYGVVMNGFDSMGHCAKFGVYTMFLLHNYESWTIRTSWGKTWYVSLIMGMFGRNVPNMQKLYMYVELVPVCQPLRLYISILPCTLLCILG